MVFYNVGWTASLMLAPFMGGFLADPVFNYPDLADRLPQAVVDVLRRFPFLPPNLAAAFLNAVSVVVFLFKLKETRAETATAHPEDETRTETVMTNNTIITTTSEEHRPTDKTPLLARKTPSRYGTDVTEAQHTRNNCRNNNNNNKTNNDDNSINNQEDFLPNRTEGHDDNCNSRFPLGTNFCIACRKIYGIFNVKVILLIAAYR